MTATEKLASRPSRNSFPAGLTDAWKELLIRIRFRFYLPRVRRAQLAGVKLEMEGLSPMMKNIILSGRYEYQERILCAEAIGSDDVVLELGSAIGFVGLYCRKKLGVKSVYGVEANPQTIQLLNRNYAANDCDPRIIHAAVAAEDGEIELDTSGEFWENRVGQAGGKSVKVPSRKLSSILEQLEESPTALVCDIEGAETQLDFSSLPASVRTIVMELHPEWTGQEAAAATEKRMEDEGFVVVKRLDNSVLLTRNPKSDS